MPEITEASKNIMVSGVRAFQQSRAKILLHGTAQRAEGAGGGEQARLDLRHYVDVIFSVASLAASGRAFRHAALTRSASDATDFFQIPTGRVVEVGTMVTV
jgi:hypothetical protein